MNTTYVYIFDYSKCRIDQVEIDHVRDFLSNEEIESILDFNLNYNLDEIHYMTSNKKLDINRLNFIYHA